jgi:hypothetical protein
MSITLNCAIDSGYGYSLGESTLKEVIISNFIKRITKEDAFLLASNIEKIDENGLIVNYKGSYYIIGKLTTKADPEIRRHSTNARVGDIYHLIEILGTLGMLCDNKSFNVNLIVGLPNKLRDSKIEMAEWLKNEWKFSYLTKHGETDRLIKIENVAVVEQPVGAIYNIPQSELQDVSIISCDVGHATTDCCIMTEGVLSINSKDWIAIEGVKRCYEALKTKLIREYQSKFGIYDILEKDIQLAIETGMFRVNKQKINITNMLNEVLDDYSEYISLEIVDKYADYLHNADYVIGSGGIMNNDYFASRLTEKLQSNKVQLAFFNNPQKSIVHGMFNIANALYEDDFANGVNEEVKEDDNK